MKAVMKIIHLSIALLGMIVSTLGISLVIGSMLLYFTETASSLSYLTQSGWIMLAILIGASSLMLVSAKMFNDNL